MNEGALLHVDSSLKCSIIRLKVSEIFSSIEAELFLQFNWILKKKNPRYAKQLIMDNATIARKIRCFRFPIRI